jgi:hypothetical protein
VLERAAPGKAWFVLDAAALHRLRDCHSVLRDHAGLARTQGPVGCLARELLAEIPSIMAGIASGCAASAGRLPHAGM